jgi:predicted O-methyltransferase YrrM
MAKTLKLPYNKLQNLELSVSRPIDPQVLIVPSIEVCELIPGSIGVSLVDLDQINGNTTLLEQLVILSVAKRRKCRRVFELGTFDGKTSANIAANLADDAEILTIDLPAEELGRVALPIGRDDLAFIIKDKIGGKINSSGKVIQLYGDTARFDFTLWYGTCNLVFVDACHEYEYVLNDSKLALELLAPGGVALWHDYGAWVGVTAGLNDLYQSDQRFRSLRHIAGTTLCLLA